MCKISADAESGVWHNEEAFWGAVYLNNIVFGFDRLGNEDGMAIFKMEEFAEEYTSEIMKRVTNCIETSSIERPAQLIRFLKTVNDTELTDLTVDEDLREICFDWISMVCLFLAEEKLKSYYLRKNVGFLLTLSNTSEISTNTI